MNRTNAKKKRTIYETGDVGQRGGDGMETSGRQDDCRLFAPFVSYLVTPPDIATSELTIVSAKSLGRIHQPDLARQDPNRRGRTTQADAGMTGRRLPDTLQACPSADREQANVCFAIYSNKHLF